MYKGVTFKNINQQDKLIRKCLCRFCSTNFDNACKTRKNIIILKNNNEN